MELLYETKRAVAVTWARAGLSKNTYVAAVAVIGTACPIATVGIEELY